MDTNKIDIALEKCFNVGITNILALRGDPALGTEWTNNNNNDNEVKFNCALDLCNYIKLKYNNYFNISVAGYPEGHPSAMTELSINNINTLSKTELQRYSTDDKIIKNNEIESIEQVINVCLDNDYRKELDYLKLKIEAGAKMIITQMFFDVEIYGIFCNNCRNHGINVPIIPGIMCISNYGGFKRMIKFCKTRVPEELMNTMEKLKDDIEGIKQFGIEFGIKMCQRLQELGAPGLHFYTLNTAPVTVAILEGLGYHAIQNENNNENSNVFTAVAAYA